MEADVIVIGGGPGGLAAAAAAGEKGAHVILIERENKLGGVLNQCIHDGFGLVKYSQAMTGPEYAARAMKDVMKENIQIMTDTIVTSIEPGVEKTVNIVCRQGVKQIRARAVVLATGCRERTRGMISIPGSRPAGIYTAGVAQNLMNTKNIMVGRKVVILGTGDIGLIMARRLTLEGAEVICALELQQDACGLSRNVRQCLQDYHIPVYLSHTITDIKGKGRLEAVEMSQVDDKGRAIPGTQQLIPCDTLILSVGLIPENEIAETAGIIPDEKSNVLNTDRALMTSVPGIFACGNCKGIMDLADYVSQEGYHAGRNAAAYALGQRMRSSEVNGVNPSQKGMPEEGVLTCIGCPIGCQLTIDGADQVTGNRCKTGRKFAISEKHDPQRILTTTVRIKHGDRVLLPVRSDRMVCLSEIRGLVSSLADMVVEAPVKAGDVIRTDVGLNGVKIVAQCDVSFDISN